MLSFSSISFLSCASRSCFSCDARSFFSCSARCRFPVISEAVPFVHPEFPPIAHLDGVHHVPREDGFPAIPEADVPALPETGKVQQGEANQAQDDRGEDDREEITPVGVNGADLRFHGPVGREGILFAEDDTMPRRVLFSESHAPHQNQVLPDAPTDRCYVKLRGAWNSSVC